MSAWRLLRRYFLPSRSFGRYMARLLTLRLLGLAFGVAAILQMLDLVDASDAILAVEGNDGSDVWRYLSLRFPDLLSRFVPFSALLAVLLTLAQLNRNSEIVVMKAAGLSPHRILLPMGLVCAVVALKEIQRVSWTRSVIAALTFPVLSAVGATVIYIVGMMQIFTTTTTLAGGFGMSLLAEAQTLSAGLDTYTRQRNGIYPAHAIELVDKDPNIVASDFVGPFTNTWTSDIPVGDTDLETYAVATGPARTAAYDAACDALPDDVIAHRVGDFVFTYHGLDGTMPPDAMWTLVGYPDPDTNATPTAGTLIAIGYADGSAREVRYSLFQTEFASQNVLRGTHGLPPIPPMHTILHGNPASGTVAVDGDETDAP